MNKYNIGDKVWYLNKNTLREYKIRNIYSHDSNLIEYDIVSENEKYRDNDDFLEEIEESFLFKSLNELKENLIIVKFK